jgi:adenylyltransferase/sulfurtransferase
MRVPEGGRVATCAQVGILGVVPGVLGTLAATEVLKLVLGIGEPLIGRLLEVDLLDADFDTIELAGDPDEGAPP